METEFGGNRKVALILSRQRAERSSLMPQELCPRSMRDKGIRILISSSCIVLSTKKYSHTLKVELFYLVWMFRTSNPGDSISVALRKLLQGGRGWVRLCTGLQHRELAVCTSKIRYQVKGSSILYLGGAASGHCLHSFPVTSAVGASPISSPTLLPAPPAPQQ